MWRLQLERFLSPALPRTGLPCGAVRLASHLLPHAGTAGSAVVTSAAGLPLRRGGGWLAKRAAAARQHAAPAGKGTD